MSTKIGFLLNTTLLLTVAASPISATAVSATYLPAVSAPNGLATGQLTAIGDGNDHAQGILGGGQWTMPLTYETGARIRGSVGFGIGSDASAREAVDASIAAFWRRPDQGFVELAANAIHLGDTDLFGGSLIGGLYREAWDFEARGVFWGSDGSTAGGGQLRVGHYLTEDLRFSLGVGAGSEHTYHGEFSAIWQPDLAQNLGFQFTGGGGAIGGDPVYTGTIAVFYYFGEGRTLRRKIRQDW